jgi:hypothetical protein
MATMVFIASLLLANLPSATHLSISLTLFSGILTWTCTTDDTLVNNHVYAVKRFPCGQRLLTV